jgi:hypothetical protein
MKHRRLSLTSAFLLVMIQLTAGAQTNREPAAVAVTEGAVFMNDQPIAPDTPGFKLPDIAVIRSGEGRAAIALKLGGWLFVDTGSSVKITNGVYNFGGLEVLSGSAIVTAGPSSPLVDCNSPFRLSDAAFARFDVQPVNSRGERPCQFRLYEGAAAVPLSSLTAVFRPGQGINCSKKCHDMLPRQDFNLGEPDVFEQWTRRTRERLQR